MHNVFLTDSYVLLTYVQRTSNVYQRIQRLPGVLGTYKAYSKRMQNALETCS